MKRNRVSYLCYFLSNVPKVLGYKLFRILPIRKKFRGLPLSLETTDQTLESALLSNKPFAAIRFGATELSALNNHEKIELGFKKTYKDLVRSSMKQNAGYFPTDDVALKRYGDELLSLLKETDYLGVSGVHMENYFARFYCPKAKYVLYEGMEPLHGCWRFALEGKKVLVISAFPNEIEEQYRQKEKLFPREEALPSFTLLTLQAPISFADAKIEEPTFFDALEKLEKEMDALDYDVLLVGAGAYGSFLVLHAKAKGKQAIQTGGATPTLFGVLGKRWEHRDHVAKYVNEFWIRPSKKPDGYQNVEQGCYW